MDDARLPVPVTVHGLLKAFSLRVHELSQTGRFKAINDTYSHAVGDRALQAVATAMLAHCREGNLAIRYAGDEFTVFLYADGPAATGSRPDTIRTTCRKSCRA